MPLKSLLSKLIEFKLKIARFLISHKAPLLILESILVLGMLCILAVGFFVWRLNYAPLDVGFAKEYVENALRDEKSGVTVRIDNVVLYWPDLQGPLLMGIRGGRILNAQNNILLSLDELDLALSKSRLVIGQIQPKSIVLKNPSLRLRRTLDNQIDFDIDFPEADPSNSDETPLSGIETLFKFMPRPVEGSDKNSPLAALREFKIENARAIIEDHKFGASWYFPSTNITLSSAEDGIKTAFKINFPSVHEEPSFIDTEILLDWDTHGIEISAALQNFDLRVLSNKFPDFDVLGDQDIVLSGSLDARLNSIFALEDLDLRVSSNSGNLNIPELSPNAVPYQAINLALSYPGDIAGKKTLTLEDCSVAIRDVTIRANGNFEDILLQEGRSIAGPLNLTIDDMPHSKIAPIWPVALQGDASEDWIVKRLSTGNFSDLKASMNLSALKSQDGWDFDIQNLIASYSFENMNIDYRAPLPPVTKASGSGVFDLDQDTLDVKVDSGSMGGLVLDQATLAFKNIVAEGKGFVKMDINLGGPLKSVFEFLSTEPIDLKDELGMDLAQVRGNTNLNVKLAFPTIESLEIEQIQMDVTGKVFEANVPDVVKTLDLSGGPFDVTVNNEQYTVKGSGKLEGRDISVEWQEYLNSAEKSYRHKAIAKINADTALQKMMGIDLSEFISGTAPINVVYTGMSGGLKAQADIVVDLTPLDFFVKSFAYQKNSGEKGSASLKANLDGEILKNISALRIETPNLLIENGQLGFAGSGDDLALSSVRFSKVKLNETLADISMDIGAGGAMKILLKGPFLDLRPFLADDDTNPKDYNEPPMIISVAVDKMRTADEDVLSRAKIYADIDSKGRFNQLELDAKAGAGDMYLRYKPDANGMRTFRFEADDAGAALKAFEVYSSIKGGKMVAYAEPIEGVFDRNLVGQAEITNFKVVDAPALARLLGALSLTGMIQLLDNEGLTFSKLESKFDWLYRPEGSLLILKDGRTTGNSLGLTFDGKFDNGASLVNVTGTIIPLSGINQMISSIPLVGDILTGGSSAIFAATYVIKGSSENPDISVNPLSVLAPGILRRILFEQ